MKKTTLITLTFICWIAVGVVCVQPIKAQYQGNVTINADGSISPSTAPIQQTGDIYTLTGDVVGSISVLRSNMTFDGNGHSLIGLGIGHGVEGLSVGGNPYSSPPVATGATNVTVKNLNAKGSVFGISLVDTLNALIFNNTISETGNGPLSLDEPTAAIYVEGGGSNTITGNNLVNNYVGIYCIETQSNLIVRNNIVNCSNTALGGGNPAIMFWGASNNTIYHNNFINNIQQAYDGSFNSPFSVNTWDDGYPDGGNYWSDYKTKYPDAAEIGNLRIGDTSYVIDSENQDRYPLMEPFTTTPPQITLLSPVNQVYNESSVDLVFTTDEAVNWTGYSLDGKQNVTITGNSTITGIPNGSHNLIVYANDTYGNMGSSQTITFTVAKPEPFPTATVAAGSGAAAVVVVAGLLVFFKKRKRQA
jgi:parallel beta-helix repeat protein